MSSLPQIPHGAILASPHAVRWREVGASLRLAGEGSGARGLHKPDVV